MPAVSASQAWHNNLHDTAALLPLGPDNRLDSGVMAKGGYKGDSVRVGNSLVKLDFVLYNERVLLASELVYTPAEFASSVLEAQVRAVDESVEAFRSAHPEGRIAFRAPALLDNPLAGSIYLRSPSGIACRWSVFNDEWRQLKSYIDVYAGAEA